MRDGFTRTRMLGRVLAVLLGSACCGGSFAQQTAPPPAPAPLQVQQVRPALSVVSGAGGNVVVWSGPDGTVLVDTGLANRAVELLETVARIAPGELRFVITTHGHVDHTGGNEAAAGHGAVLVGHERLRERSGRDVAVVSGERGSAAAAALPVVTTTDRMAFHLNGDRLDVLPVASAHTGADLTVRWATANVIALGDVYWNGQYPIVDVAAGGSIAGLVAAVEAALARSNASTVVVPGHGAVSNRAQLAAYRDMLVAVGRKVRAAVENGEGLEQVQATHPTSEFDARFFGPGVGVSPDDFVRNVYEDFTRRR
ncbi:MAG TPA: MBL fold metallo-hydrolase [Steroidobacteraceae bacterium]|nr:MBL fold metallo-hydrolase [Steroidobacteraceae bacterium]